MNEAADASQPKERLFPEQLLRLVRCLPGAGRTADDAVLTANYQFGSERKDCYFLLGDRDANPETRTLTFLT